MEYCAAAYGPAKILQTRLARTCAVGTKSAHVQIIQIKLMSVCRYHMQSITYLNDLISQKSNSRETFEKVLLRILENVSYTVFTGIRAFKFQRPNVWLRNAPGVCSNEYFDFKRTITTRGWVKFNMNSSLRNKFIFVVYGLFKAIDFY